MCQRKLRLISSTTNKKTQNSLTGLFAKWDIELISSTQANGAAADGLVVCGEEATMDSVILPDQVQDATANASQGRQLPFLILVFGESDSIPSGLADELHRKYAAHPVEVVRFFLMPSGNRAIIGGEPEGHWVSCLRRLAAREGIISLVCARTEVDEIVWQLDKYLRLKQRFYLHMARRYESGLARLGIVAQALGMDERIGQGWLYQDGLGKRRMKEIERWLQNNMKAVLTQFRPQRVVVCGYYEQIDSLTAWLIEQEPRIQTCTYAVDLPENTNEKKDKTLICRSLPELLLDAELLVIVGADSALEELHLERLTQQMKRPTVIDALSLFPVDEAKLFGITYITYGQNTNDRNENYTGRK
ncbi:UNVERIFIED_CONTAM: hypothetical protein ABID98_003852 [Brevibacillus sp. OAP136]